MTYGNTVELADSMHRASRQAATFARCGCPLEAIRQVEELERRARALRESLERDAELRRLAAAQAAADSHARFHDLLSGLTGSDRAPAP